MSFNEVKELRVSGKLDEAHLLAKSDLEANPNDIWCKRALAWVYYDYIKHAVINHDSSSLVEMLKNIVALELPEEEHMIFDQLAWQIGKHLYATSKNERFDSTIVDKLFSIFKTFHFTKPSDAYSYLMKAHLSIKDKWHQFVEFVDWWDLDSFLPDDYLEEEFNKKKILSLVERVLIGYSKTLLKDNMPDFGGISIDHLIFNSSSNSKIQQFLPQLDKYINDHPNYIYLPYYKAQMLIKTGDSDEVMSSFLPFARKKRNEFWVWEILAQVRKDEPDVVFACYCKALSLGAPDEYLGKVRMAFTRLLIQKYMYSEAKTEIEIVAQTYHENKWNKPAQILRWENEEWYGPTNAKANNAELYNKYSSEAEALLYEGVPEEFVVVDFVNKDKYVVHFVANRQKYGHFKYDRKSIKPEIGDILAVRMIGDQQSGKYNILSARNTDGTSKCDAIKSFEGVLQVNPNKPFGFVDQVFVEPQLISSKGLTNGQHVSGKAVLSYNKKKEEVGWKVLRIN